ncbi:MAG: putative metal-binding motif-containing protein, partial [Myxococcota bacterium]|nr:putative metal-binding motif-containing protein [Myxococcota bacterium]
EDAFNQPTWYQDADNDNFGTTFNSIQACQKPVGYVLDSTDCDDSNNTVYTNAPELCDGIVNNCGNELSTDEIDQDGDGFGDASQSVVACPSELLTLDETISYVANADDCDDSDSETYPGSSREGGELCVRDADGDGYGDSTAAAPYDAGTDCNDADASIFPNNARFEDDELCVVDADGDGYGDAIPSVAADPGSDCDDSNALIYPGYNNESGTLCILDADGDGFGQANAPQPYDSGSDCNDTDAEIHPDMEESCDGVDNNCSGEVDDYQGNNAPRWYYDDDNDGYGNATSSQNACAQPAGYVGNSDDCNDGDATINPGATEIDNDGID